MVKSLRSVAGLGIIAAGVIGLAYALPMISNIVAAKSVVFKESDVPATPNSIIPYVATAIASTGLIIGGITLSVMGQVQSDRLPSATTLTPSRQRQDMEENAEGGSEKKDARATEGA